MFLYNLLSENVTGGFDLEINVLNADLELVAIIDQFQSLIWANRYNDLGDCELLLPATDDNISVSRVGYYLQRLDDDMVCRINKIEIGSDAETGTFLIVSGVDVKYFLDSRVLLGTATCKGNVEDFIRELVYDSLCENADSDRMLKFSDGNCMFHLGEKYNFQEVTQEQISYKNIGEKVRNFCTTFDWGYRVKVEDDGFYFEIYKGEDRTNEVLFSDDFENLKSTEYVEDYGTLDNVALVCGEGEGSDRIKTIVGGASGANRYEVYVDARSVSKNITWKELQKSYTQDERFSILPTEDEKVFIYHALYIDILTRDRIQLYSLQSENPNGELIRTNDNLYYRVYNVDVAELPSNSPTENDTVILKDIAYIPYLVNKGIEELSTYGKAISFDGAIEPFNTFIYKSDYFLGDVVKIETEFGVSANARIVEVVECMNDSGYTIEPKFSYSSTDNFGSLFSEDDRLLLSEDYDILEAN